MYCFKGRLFRDQVLLQNRLVGKLLEVLVPEETCYQYAPSNHCSQCHFCFGNCLSRLWCETVPSAFLPFKHTHVIPFKSHVFGPLSDLTLFPSLLTSEIKVQETVPRHRSSHPRSSHHSARNVFSSLQAFPASQARRVRDTTLTMIFIRRKAQPHPSCE